MGHLTVAFVLGLVLGGAFGYFTGDRAGGTAGDGSAGQRIERESRTDRYGRSPGHPHYMHDHP